MTETDPPSHIRLVEEGADPPPDNVVKLPAYYYRDVNPDEILREAIGKLASVVIIGYTKREDGEDKRRAEEEFFASSIAAGDAVVWLLQRYIHKLITYGDDDSTFGPDGDIPPAS